MKNVLIFIIFIILSLATLSCSKGKTLLMGTCAIYPPFTHISDNNEHIGFDVELATIIAKNYGKKLEITNMSFSDLIPAVENATIDMAMSSMTITEERGKIIDFSNSYFEVSQAIIVRKDNLASFEHITTKEELGREKTLGAERGSTCSGYAKEIADGREVFEDSFEIVLEKLMNGEIDAAIMDGIISKTYISKYDDLILFKNITFEPENYGIAIRKGNSKLMNSINKTIYDLLVSGKYQVLVDEHVTSSLKK